MKKFVFVIFILLNNVFNSSAQIYLNAFIDFIWGEWKPISSEIVIDGNYDGFIIYSKKEGPWNYRFKFTIDDMTFPIKKQRKKDIKDGKWYEFEGSVEYYISDDYPNAYSMFKENKGPYQMIFDFFRCIGLLLGYPLQLLFFKRKTYYEDKKQKHLFRMEM